MFILLEQMNGNISKINDSRTSAISQGTSRILNEIDVWDKVRNNAQEICSILVKEGNGSVIDFNSKSMQEGPLGFIVENKITFIMIIDNLLKWP